MDLRAVQRAHGLEIEPLTVREARSREPLLSPAISCALDIPADHQVDPRKLVACLRRALAGHGRGSHVPQSRVRSTVSPSPTARRRWLLGGRPGYRREAGGRGTGQRRGNRGGQRAAGGLAGRTARRAPACPCGPCTATSSGCASRNTCARWSPPLSAAWSGACRSTSFRGSDGTVVIGATQREDALLRPARRTAEALPASRRAASTSCCATPRCWCRLSPSWNCWKARPRARPARRTTRRCWAASSSRKPRTRARPHGGHRVLPPRSAADARSGHHLP